MTAKTVPADYMAVPTVRETWIKVLSSWRHGLIPMATLLRLAGAFDRADPTPWDAFQLRQALDEELAG